VKSIGAGQGFKKRQASAAVQAGLRIYRADRKKMIQEFPPSTAAEILPQDTRRIILSAFHILKSKRRKYPMKDEDYNIPEDQDYTSAVSAYDCTGLIPAGTVHEKTLEAYRELYPFGAPEMSEKEMEQMREKDKKENQD
jgi:hypothetical protein